VVSYSGGKAAQLGFTLTSENTPMWSLMSRMIGKPTNVTNYFFEFDMDLGSISNIPADYPISLNIRPGYGSWAAANSPWSVNLIYQLSSPSHGISFSWRDKNNEQQIRYFPLINPTDPHTMRVEAITTLAGGKLAYVLSFDVDAVEQMNVEVGENVFDIDQLHTFCGFRRLAGATSSCQAIWDNVDVQYEYVAAARPKAPANVSAIARGNYNVLWWDAVTVNEDDTPVSGGIQGYNIYKSVLINGSGPTIIKTITTTDAGGLVDTAYLDTAQDVISVYKVASFNSSMVESEVSERAIAIKTNSMINDKEEYVDRKLFRLGISRLGEDILA